MEVGPVVTDISCAQELAELACGHQLPISGRHAVLIKSLFCVTCDESRGVLIYRPLKNGEVVHWPARLAP